MNDNEREHVLAELDALHEDVAGTMQRFEAAGFTAVMKDDYVELHALQQRIAEMRLQYSRGQDAADIKAEAAVVRH